MKQISSILSRLAMVLASVFMGVVAFAQEKATDINVDISSDKGGNWYAQPWVWIVGGAVFILLLVALLRSNNRARE